MWHKGQMIDLLGQVRWGGSYQGKYLIKGLSVYRGNKRIFQFNLKEKKISEVVQVGCAKEPVNIYLFKNLYMHIFIYYIGICLYRFNISVYILIYL